jgi:hypothetical protein
MQCTIFAFALLGDETTDTFKWVLIPSWSAWVVWLQDASSQVCTRKYSLYCIVGWVYVLVCMTLWFGAIVLWNFFALYDM